MKDMRVNRKTTVAELAQSIVRALAENETVKVWSMGPVASYTMMKGIAATEGMIPAPHAHLHFEHIADHGREMTALSCVLSRNIRGIFCGREGEATTADGSITEKAP